MNKPLIIIGIAAALFAGCSKKEQSQAPRHTTNVVAAAEANNAAHAFRVGGADAVNGRQLPDGTVEIVGTFNPKPPEPKTAFQTAKETAIEAAKYGIPALVLVVLLCGTFFTVEQQDIAVVERFGKFKKFATAGLNFKVPFIDDAAHAASLQVQELTLEDRKTPHVSTKTKDDVTCNIGVQVQYRVNKDKIYEAVYSLEDVESQMFSFLYDSVRSIVPTMTLDEVFAEKETVATATMKHLESAMAKHGYDIVAVLITSVNPNEKVQEAMNEINTAKRMRMAAEERGEADRILQVKKAQAEAESKALQGKGIADQRRAIIDGLKESVSAFKESVEGATAKDVMGLVLMTQYFDTLKELGENSAAKTIFIPHSPGAVGDIGAQLRNAMVSANEA